MAGWRCRSEVRGQKDRRFTADFHFIQQGDT
jgi:hypothetical protein